MPGCREFLTLGRGIFYHTMIQTLIFSFLGGRILASFFCPLGVPPLISCQLNPSGALSRDSEDCVCLTASACHSSWSVWEYCTVFFKVFMASQTVFLIHIKSVSGRVNKDSWPQHCCVGRWVLGPWGREKNGVSYLPYILAVVLLMWRGTMTKATLTKESLYQRLLVPRGGRVCGHHGWEAQS